jgi:hypothetical protein
MVDDHDSWGNTTAQPQALATRQESLNGREEQLLASDEGAVAAYLGMGKSYEKERKLRSVAFIPRRRERERERGVWSRTSATGRRHRAGPTEPGTPRVSPTRSR